MKGLKGVIVASTIVAAAAVLGGCYKDIDTPPLKFGAGDVVVEKNVR